MSNISENQLINNCINPRPDSVRNKEHERGDVHKTDKPPYPQPTSAKVTSRPAAYSPNPKSEESATFRCFFCGSWSSSSATIFTPSISMVAEAAASAHTSDILKSIIGRNKASTLVDFPDIPVALLCALDKKCDLQYFTSDDGCEADTEVCAKPMASPSTPGTPYNLTCLTCADPIMALRHRQRRDLDGDWVMVKYVTCNGEGFTVYLEDNQKFDKFVQRIQCVKLTTCFEKNPLRSDCEGKPDCGTIRNQRLKTKDQRSRPKCDFNDSYKEYTCNHEDQFMVVTYSRNGWAAERARLRSRSTVIPLTGLALILIAAFQSSDNKVL
ncbi:hypothetical protein PRIPAC_90086 [Pristionchus pacificus]|uniref:Uncharacterized protein n=1 Tax=Pristionchus pacificus TaxID=54126 RepID=A0A2A6CW30_PRIPA|nr:hypothetical protein PRIPAC_90086 [Pristionchus pacificus]|eukprot:PDM82243.1 hypothetical protein PRIPAC_36636 [Pristionchus pacificus]